MLRLIPMLLLAANQPAAPGHLDPGVSPSRGGTPGQVDGSWLERALRRDPDANAKALVAEFARAHPSKALPRGMVVDEGAYLRILTANLDEDPEPEHLLVIGPAPWHTELYVLDRRDEGWAIVFEEDFDLLNEEPRLHLLPDGLFYLRTLHERGSGVWLYTWRFFKLADGRVDDALEIVQESNLQMEASDLYQHAKATVGALRPRWPRRGEVPCLMELGEEGHVAAAFQLELEKLAKKGNADQRAVAAYLLRKASAK